MRLGLALSLLCLSVVGALAARWIVEEQAESGWDCQTATEADSYSCVWHADEDCVLRRLRLVGTYWQARLEVADELVWQVSCGEEHDDDDDQDRTTRRSWTPQLAVAAGESVRLVVQGRGSVEACIKYVRLP
jgi:hypothetical protein